MPTALHQKLRAEVLSADWPDLAPHFARGAMLLCAAELDLVDLGVALAQDDVARVGAWVADGRVRKPGDAEARAWSDADPGFDFLIVAPFVVARER